MVLGVGVDYRSKKHTKSCFWNFKTEDQISPFLIKIKTIQQQQQRNIIFYFEATTTKLTNIIKQQQQRKNDRIRKIIDFCFV